jgi:hypothetical protein
MAGSLHRVKRERHERRLNECTACSDSSQVGGAERSHLRRPRSDVTGGPRRGGGAFPRGGQPDAVAAQRSSPAPETPLIRRRSALALTASSWASGAPRSATTASPANFSPSRRTPRRMRACARSTPIGWFGAPKRNTYNRAASHSEELRDGLAFEVVGLKGARGWFGVGSAPVQGRLEPHGSAATEREAARGACRHAWWSAAQPPGERVRVTRGTPG